jgi:hypothetical protein
MVPFGFGCTSSMFDTSYAKEGAATMSDPGKSRTQKHARTKMRLIEVAAFRVTLK